MIAYIMEKLKPKIQWLLWVWFGLAVALRVYKVSLIRCIAPDGTAYIDAAQKMICGGGPGPVWPPGYPWLIGILMRAGIRPELCAQAVSVVFGAMTVFLVWAGVKYISSSASAAYTALIFTAVHPYLVRYSAEALSDSMFTFMLTACILSGWLAVKKSGIGCLFLTGASAAAAYLTKPEGIVLPAVISAYWFVKCRRPYRALCLWIIFFAAVLPYMHSVKEKTGHWQITGKQAIVFSSALQNAGIEDRFKNVTPLEYAGKHPVLFAKKVFGDALKLMERLPDAFTPFLFILLIAGAAGYAGNKSFFLYLSLFIVIFFTGYAVYHPGRRYLTNWVPVTMFIPVWGAERIGRAVKKKHIVTAIAVLTMLVPALSPVREKSARWKRAGVWAGGHSRRGDIIMSEDIRSAFYARRDYMPLDAEKAGKAVLIVTDKDIKGMKPVYRTKQGVNIYRVRD